MKTISHKRTTVSDLKKSKLGWFRRIRRAFTSPEGESFGAYGRRILTPLINSEAVTPPKKLVFKALELVPFENVKIVLLGQDPYPQVEDGISFATGLAFALNPEILKRNPGVKLGTKALSLRKILNALSSELKIERPENPETSLESWAKQGVLLLNLALTTSRGKPGSHTKAWHEFISTLIKVLNSHKKSLIFVLTCKEAREFKSQIAPHHQIFFNYKHPSRCWRISDKPKLKEPNIHFFALTTSRGLVNWETVFKTPQV